MKAKVKSLSSRLLNSVFDFLSDEKLIQVVFNIISHRAK